MASDPVDDRAAGEGGGSRLSELGTYIRHQRDSAKLSLRQLAKLAGVSNPYLSQIERGLRKPSAEILQAIAKALEIQAESLYVKAGILDEREPDEDLEVTIARNPHLSDTQRRTLIEMYRGFRRLNEIEERQKGGRGVRGLIDSLSTGDVDDAAIRAASAPSEDVEEV